MKEVTNREYADIIQHLSFAGEILRTDPNTRVQNKARMMRVLARRLQAKYK